MSFGQMRKEHGGLGQRVASVVKQEILAVIQHMRSHKPSPQGSGRVPCAEEAAGEISAKKGQSLLLWV